MVEKRDHETIRTTHPAGILEHGSVNMLVDSGVSDRVLTTGYEHEGIDLRLGGVSHRIDFTDLVGEAVWLYPQNKVFVDLAAARERDGGQVDYSVTDSQVSDQHRSPRRCPEPTSGSQPVVAADDHHVDPVTDLPGHPIRLGHIQITGARNAPPCS